MEFLAPTPGMNDEKQKKKHLRTLNLTPSTPQTSGTEAVMLSFSAKRGTKIVRPMMLRPFTAALTPTAQRLQNRNALFRLQLYKK